ncbi:hypothetical protein PPN77_06510 [Proteus mirabilis]|uniref:hypothetical protein n=1 Tax=Proteus mirabilis TaxID=584 RepID=UPI00234A6F65|nr:hypothetical protein [Proteus mirabilis]EKX5058431.1 hypothetical protein [Proteus mirabilis]MDC5897864.1 hypothetical protein [Proteus mirabilis]MDC5901340.1 hypothetical protein [Proteus mirabilis]MDC5918996.1 hypothetical protein [Proteus mirabilis]MDC5929520.1 hypothetical protein [Proteus mirabilis]
MSKQMVLVARTNKVGSDSEVSLGMTEEGWNELDEANQGVIIGDALETLVDYWVQPED